MIQPYPQPDTTARDEAESRPTRSWTMDAILGVRGIRGEFDIAPSRQIEVYVENATADDRRRFESSASAIRKLAGIGEVRWLSHGERAAPSRRRRRWAR